MRIARSSILSLAQAMYVHHSHRIPPGWNMQNNEKKMADDSEVPHTCIYSATQPRIDNSHGSRETKNIYVYI